MRNQKLVEQLSAIMNKRTRVIQTQMEGTTHGRIFDMIVENFNLSTAEQDELFDSELFWKLEEAMAEVIDSHFEG